MAVSALPSWFTSGTQSLYPWSKTLTVPTTQFVSQQVGTILDVEDIVPGGQYTLEVSSPGVERKLLKPKDFERFQGKKAKVTLRDPIDGRRNWEGTLAGIEDGLIRLDLERGGPLRFPFDHVQKANLKFEW